jgi:hypothetical protein
MRLFIADNRVSSRTSTPQPQSKVKKLMFDKTADQSDVALESRKRSDLVFPLVFSATAVVVTVVWLGAIGWLIWQPIGHLAGWLFE